jgi:hypothetical protein
MALQIINEFAVSWSPSFQILIDQRPAKHPEEASTCANSVGRAHGFKAVKAS